ncbi:MAG: hypothetical protein OXC69_08460 [Candidatus Tectomicrobia bacterium]|nr:hypothetical protein [Candidatus Tectomicrobia bacterium]
MSPIWDDGHDEDRRARRSPAPAIWPTNVKPSSSAEWEKAAKTLNGRFAGRWQNIESPC